ncbi:MAG: xanthine dehydrogenase family protein subunit M [Rhodomicrobium sp.]
MKPAPFAYHVPHTLPEAIELLSLENSKLLAGGQSLVPMLNMRFAVPGNVIDLNRLTGVSGIRRDGNSIEIGAMTRQCDLEASSIIAEALPILSEALPHIGHFQTRSRGTIGGSLCHLDPSAELPALCLLMDAELTVSGPKGTRAIPAGQWFEGFMQPALAQDEVLTSIRIPAWEKRHGYGCCEFSRRHGDFAIAGAAALLNLDSRTRVSRAAITVFGLEFSPRRLLEAEKALEGSDASQATFAEAADAVSRLDAMDDAMASAKYRRKLGVTLVRRALDMAHQRAKVSGA